MSRTHGASRLAVRPRRRGWHAVRAPCLRRPLGHARTPGRRLHRHGRVRLERALRGRPRRALHARRRGRHRDLTARDEHDLRLPGRARIAHALHHDGAQVSGPCAARQRAAGRRRAGGRGGGAWDRGTSFRQPRGRSFGARPTHTKRLFCAASRNLVYASLRKASRCRFSSAPAAAATARRCLPRR